MIIAVDFDCTLYLGKNQYPSVDVEPNLELINILLEQQRAGAKLILWTCRHGKPLEDAIEWCKEFGLIFDAVNDDVQERIDYWKDNRGKKIYADIYIDDSSLHPKYFVLKAYKAGLLELLNHKEN